MRRWWGCCWCVLRCGWVVFWKMLFDNITWIWMISPCQRIQPPSKVVNSDWLVPLIYEPECGVLKVRHFSFFQALPGEDGLMYRFLLVLVIPPSLRWSEFFMNWFHPCEMEICSWNLWCSLSWSPRKPEQHGNTVRYCEVSVDASRKQDIGGIGLLTPAVFYSRVGGWPGKVHILWNRSHKWRIKLFREKAKCWGSGFCGLVDVYFVLCYFYSAL